MRLRIGGACVRLMWALSLILSLPPLTRASWAHPWTSGADWLWADFNSMELLAEDRASFIASTYHIMSLEKCWGRAQNYTTEDAFIIQARALKAVNPAIKTVFYFHATVDISGPAFAPCYASGAYFLAHPELWMFNDTGSPLMNGPFIFHNLTTAAGERYLVEAVLGVQRRAPELLDGVFSDGALAQPYAGVASQARADAENAAINAVALAQSLALNAAAGAPAEGVRVIGNGLALYALDDPAFPPDLGMSMVPFMDGVCVEHWGAFEMVNTANCSLIPARTAQLLGLIADVAAQNKTVLIKGWPGPVTTPITDVGPSWPASCGAPAGATREQRGRDALAWFTPSYALFLLAVEPTVFWSYSWWYDVADGYWAPSSAAEANLTSAPQGWYPDLQRPLGSPAGPAARLPGGSGWLYQRAFEHALVTVDLADYKSGTIVWT